MNFIDSLITGSPLKDLIDVVKYRFHCLQILFDNIFDMVNIKWNEKEHVTD